VLATTALIAYREWLKQNLSSMRQDFSLGSKPYGFFLHQVALLPYTPEQLLAMARQDFDRILAMEGLRAPTQPHGSPIAESGYF
jgi:hypothetical protein